MSQKSLLLILGNGFTIDFLHHIQANQEIDVVNLFRLGAEVPWPASGMPGFLSFKHCPHLWNLGARPNMSSADAMSLIEDIITSVNVFATREAQPKIRSEYRPNDIYIYAYQELLQYLKNLFIFYNNKIIEIPDIVSDWSWLKFIKDANESNDYNDITIITYNYDIWLERTLTKEKIPFNVSMIGNKETCKINIIKPHGSISFTHDKKLDIDSYRIKYDREILDGSTDDFNISYNDLSGNYLVTALIPPAGESSRFNHTWASQLRHSAKNKAKSLSEDDEMIMCGLSYWHVDRAELDELISVCPQSINATMVNPTPLRTLTAVLTSIFSNFVSYPNSKILKERMK